MLAIASGGLNSKWGPLYKKRLRVRWLKNALSTLGRNSDIIDRIFWRLLADEPLTNLRAFTYIKAPTLQHSLV